MFEKPKRKRTPAYQNQRKRLFLMLFIYGTLMIFPIFVWSSLAYLGNFVPALFGLAASWIIGKVVAWLSRPQRSCSLTGIALVVVILWVSGATLLLFVPAFLAWISIFGYIPESLQFLLLPASFLLILLCMGLVVQIGMITETKAIIRRKENIYKRKNTVNARLS